jgi:hypothetical protein
MAAVTSRRRDDVSVPFALAPPPVADRPGAASHRTSISVWSVISGYLCG